MQIYIDYNNKNNNINHIIMKVLSHQNEDLLNKLLQLPLESQYVNNVTIENK
jgi:hypothetical protein